MPQLFYPPKLNLGLVRFTHAIAPLAAKLFYKLQIQVSDADLDKLRALRHERVILLVNHPSFHDPIPIMLLSGKLKQAFYYLASIEQFEGFLGKYFQRIGSYSVRRGMSDRPSIKQTLALLSQPETHLVIFPEGGGSFQNDQVMPFRTGAIQLAFQALNREYKQHKTVSNCFVVTVTIKYKYTQDVTPVIHTMLAKLENKLQLRPDASLTTYERLRAIASQVLNRIEADYGVIPPNPSESEWNQRVETLRDQILNHCETTLQIKTNPNAPIRERTYQLEDALQTYIRETKAETKEHESDSRSHNLLDDGCEQTIRLIDKSIRRLLNFNAIYDGYVAEAPTPERYLETLIRLEREVFDIDQPSVKGSRLAHLSVGNPINLKDSFKFYQRDRNHMVEKITRELQYQAQSQLDQQQLNL